MEYLGVGEELDVTNIENHVEGEAEAGGLKDFHSLDLLWGERWDDACIGETAKGLNVVRVPSKEALLVI